jgi:AcrR family transcriptional regulator
MQAVLDEVGERLMHSDESLIRIPDICEATGVNYGSVYHHFGSREGVIDAAYNQMFLRYAEQDIALLKHLSESAKTLEEFSAGFTALMSTFSSRPDRSQRRSIRIRIVAASLTRPALKALIGQTQSRVTEELMVIVQYGQDRGWLRSDVSAQSVAVALQALLVGRVIDDISALPVDPAEWGQTMAVFYSSLLVEQ